MEKKTKKIMLCFVIIAFLGLLQNSNALSVNYLLEIQPYQLNDIGNSLYKGNSSLSLSTEFDDTVKMPNSFQNNFSISSNYSTENRQSTIHQTMYNVSSISNFGLNNESSTNYISSIYSENISISETTSNYNASFQNVSGIITDNAWSIRSGYGGNSIDYNKNNGIHNSTIEIIATTTLGILNTPISDCNYVLIDLWLNLTDTTTETYWGFTGNSPTYPSTLGFDIKLGNLYAIVYASTIDTGFDILPNTYNHYSIEWIRDAYGFSKSFKIWLNNSLVYSTTSVGGDRQYFFQLTVVNSATMKAYIDAVGISIVGNPYGVYTQFSNEGNTFLNKTINSTIPNLTNKILVGFELKGLLNSTVSFNLSAFNFSFNCFSVLNLSYSNYNYVSNNLSYIFRTNSSGIDLILSFQKYYSNWTVINLNYTILQLNIFYVKLSNFIIKDYNELNAYSGIILNANFKFNTYISRYNESGKTYLHFFFDIYRNNTLFSNFTFLFLNENYSIKYVEIGFEFSSFIYSEMSLIKTTYFNISVIAFDSIKQKTSEQSVIILSGFSETIVFCNVYWYSMQFGIELWNRCKLVRQLRLKSSITDIYSFFNCPNLFSYFGVYVEPPPNYNPNPDDYIPPDTTPSNPYYWTYTSYSVVFDSANEIYIGKNSTNEIKYEEYSIQNLTYSNITKNYSYDFKTTDETYSYPVSEFHYKFNTVKGVQTTAYYYYNPNLIPNLSIENLGDWGTLWNWLRNGLVIIVNFFVNIFNGVILMIQYAMYLLLIAINFIVLQTFCLYIIPFIWNTLAYWIIYAIVFVVYYVILGIYLALNYGLVGLTYILNVMFVGLIIMLVFIVNSIIWLWYNVILPFLTWIWQIILLVYNYLKDNIQPIVKTIIHWLIIIISFIEACLVWILVLGSLDFNTIYTNIYNFNTLIADFTIEFGTIFFENILYFLMYIAMYLILMGFVLLKLIYCKSKGYSWRAYDLDNLLEAYKYPIKIVVSIVKYFKDLISGWL